MTDELTIKPEVQKGIQTLQDYADSLEITDEKQASEAGVNLYKIADLKKAVEDQRVQITKPMNMSLKATNSFFKKFSDPLDAIDAIIRDKVKTFSDTTTETAYGVIHMRKGMKVEVEDISKIPYRFLKLDETAVKAALKAGEEIPGIKVIETKTVSL